MRSMSMANEFFSFDIPMPGGDSGCGGGLGSSTVPGIPPQRLSMSVKELSCEAYRGIAPVEDGSFIIAKPLGEGGLLCALVDPAGRGPRAVEVGARLKDAVEGLLGADFLRYAGIKPAAALERLDATLDQAMSELAMPGAFTMMGAVIVSGRTGRVSLLCRGIDGAAGLRSGGKPMWAAGGEAPPYGGIPREFLLMRNVKLLKEYQLRPGDSLVIANPHFAELPGEHEASEKNLLPLLAARAKRGGRLEASGLTLKLPPAKADGLSIPERMAVEAHALRLAALQSDLRIDRGELALDPEQAGYFEAVCMASGLQLPTPERDERGFVHYADASPLAVKGLVAVSIMREVS